MIPPAEDTVHSVWIVVQTRPMQEVKAKAELERKGFEVYLPMKLFTNKRGDLQASPFFPRYLFARITAEVGRWRDVWSTPGVSAVLCRSEFRPYGVRDFVVQQIRAREEGGFIKLGIAPSGPKFTAGAPVRARVNGVDLEAVFQERVDERRATVLVKWLGAERRATVDLRKLEAA